MARVGSVRQSPWTFVVLTAACALLLSFGAFDVLDLDGSNLPDVVKTATTAFQDERPAEAERSPLKQWLEWPQLKVLTHQARATSQGVGGRASSIRPLTCFIVVQSVRQALPRGNLGSPSPLV